MEKISRYISPILFGCAPSMFTAILKNKMMMVERTMSVMWQLLHEYWTMSCQSVGKDFQYNHIEKECLHAILSYKNYRILVSFNVLPTMFKNKTEPI